MSGNRNGERSIGKILWYGNILYIYDSKFLDNLVNQCWDIHYNVCGWFIVEEVQVLQCWTVDGKRPMGYCF